MLTPRHARISGTGAYLPERTVLNTELTARWGGDPQRVQELFGFRERRYARPGETTSDMAVAAARRALGAAGLQPHDVGLLVLATTTPDRKVPSCAAIAHEKLELEGIPAFDLNAACAGFLYGLSVAHDAIAAGRAEHVLVIGADTISSIIDFEHRDNVFFGDGAGAAVVSASAVPGIERIRCGAGGTHRLGLTVEAGGAEWPVDAHALAERRDRFTMDGRRVAQNALRYFPRSIREVLAESELTTDDVDWFILHQPSRKLLTSVQSALGLPAVKLPTNLERYGNTVAATVPILLDEKVRGNDIRPGQRIVLASFGAGWTWGACSLRWVV